MIVSLFCGILLLCCWGKTGVRLPRGEDGCPSFGHPSTMPADWSWKTCTLVMVRRWGVMKWGCNKRWKTMDTPTTIYLECCFQACVGRMVVSDDGPEAEMKRELQRKYTEFLGLPLGVENYNPLTFAVAHRVSVSRDSHVKVILLTSI